MTKRALKALRKSIKHWEDNVSGKTHTMKREACALCGEFWSGETDDCCGGCPISEKTGDVFCVGSPYGELDDHACEFHEKLSNESKFDLDCKECMRLVRKELAFLKRLVPKEKK